MKIWLICGKCGSNEIAVIIKPDDEEGSRVQFSCRNCVELTGIGELADQQNEILEGRYK